MARIITDLITRFKHGSIALRFIYWNVGIFLATTLVSVGFRLFNHQAAFLRWLECPADVYTLLRQPWSLFTYMFLHADVLHVLFNMLWLYWFGELFLRLFSQRHFRGLYLLGGLCGSVLYIAAYNLFPYFGPFVGSSYLLGASASVLAIAVATAVREPDYPVSLLFVGTIRLKYLTLALIVLDLLFITSGNAGGHIAHLGGALAGFWFAKAFQRYDATAWINAVIDRVTRLGRRPRKKPKMTVHYGGRAADYDYNARRKANEDEINRILEKIKKTGYNNLTHEEKQRLFDASKK